MSGLKIEDIRFSSSSVDDFFQEKKFRKSVAASGRVRIASVHQLAGFHMVSDDQLIRLSQNDFWKLGQDSEGFFIERLVDDGSGPVKG
jgi:hypothetical protein